MTVAPPIFVAGAGLPGGEARLMELAPVREAQVLVAGRKLLATLAHPTAEALPVGADVDGLLATLAERSARGLRVAVLCSGDPLFFGLGSRLLEHFGQERLHFAPAPGTLQAAAALCGLDVQSIRAVSLHGGRSRLPLLHALMDGGPVLALTDAASDPAGLAALLLERGFCGCTLHVLEELFLDAEGAPAARRRLRLSLQDAASRLRPSSADTAGQEEFSPTAQRVLVFVPHEATPARCVFRPDAAYAAQGGLITKAPVRAAALALLGVEEADTVWDLGAGSGAVGLEAAGLARRGLVAAVEAHPERAEQIRANRARFGVLHLEVVTASLPDALPRTPEEAGAVEVPLAICSGEEHDSDCPKIPRLPRPKRIFIGGGLGSPEAAEEILRRAWACLLPGGRLVASCVLLGSMERTRRFFAERSIEYGMEEIQSRQAVPLAGDLRLVPDNPVFLVHATKGDV